MNKIMVKIRGNANVQTFETWTAAAEWMQMALTIMPRVKFSVWFGTIAEEE